MATWTATKSWPVGTVVTETDANAYWRDNLDYLKGELDRGAIPSGLLADRPATPIVGDSYFATDTSAFYACSTAGAWDAVGFAATLEGVSNPAGNVDIVPGGAITVAGDDTANTITISETHSARTDNPHSVTAAQSGAAGQVNAITAGDAITITSSGDITVTTSGATVTVGGFFSPGRDIVRFVANDLTGANLSAVTAWAEHYNRYTVTVHSAPILYTDYVNGQNAVYFDGVDDYLDFSVSYIGYDVVGYTFLAVVKPYDTSAGDRIILDGYNSSGSGNVSLASNTDTAGKWGFRTYGDAATSDIGDNSADWQLLVVGCTGKEAYCYGYRNGTHIADLTFAAVNDGQSIHSTVYLGSHGGTEDYFHGWIAEVVLFAGYDYTNGDLLSRWTTYAKDRYNIA